jgi:cysteinyl-tRNA synthetase
MLGWLNQEKRPPAERKIAGSNPAPSFLLGDFMEIKLLNTMGRKKEIFKPINKKEVRMYCCGPTVYNYAHIGNLRTYIFEDVLRRVLEFNGFKVKHVMNITDVGHLTSDADTGEDNGDWRNREAGGRHSVPH